VPSIRLSSTYAAARIPITASILLYISYRIARDWEATRDVLEFRWDPIAILLATTSGLGAYTLLVIAWMVLLNHNMHFDRRYLPYYFRIWFVAYIYRYVPGKIMVIAERARMGTRIGIPAVRGSAIAFMETVYVLSAAVYCSLLVMPMFFDKGVLVWAASAGFVLMGSFLSSFLLRYSARVPYLKERLEDLSTLRLTHKAVLAVVLLYVLFWVLLGCSFFFFARMFYPFALSELPYLFGLFTFVLQFWGHRSFRTRRRRGARGNLGSWSF